MIERNQPLYGAGRREFGSWRKALQAVDPSLVKLLWKRGITRDNQERKAVAGARRRSSWRGDAGGERYGDAGRDDEVNDEAKVTIGDVAGSTKRLVYTYDLGDGWSHEMEIEKAITATSEKLTIRCLAGARACPPDSCSGVPGYAHLIEVLGDPDDEEHAEMVKWVGRRFDPEASSFERVNIALRGLRAGRRGGWQLRAEGATVFESSDRQKVDKADGIVPSITTALE
jgi:hypothetical protein